MAHTRNEEKRLLSKDEFDLVERSRQPAIASLSDAEVGEMLARLRDMRDRAQTIERQQRREIRRKAAPSGARPASDNSGSIGKADLLASAVQRMNKERSRRRAKTARDKTRDGMVRALRSKRSMASSAPQRPASRTADEGMKPIPNETGPVSGAFDEAGHRPVLERSRKVR